MEYVQLGEEPILGQPGCGLPNDGVREKNESMAYCRTVAYVPDIDLGDWCYGSLRGGTPAVLLPGGKHYLALFHTRHHIPDNMLETYFMGAVTWCANVSNLHLYSMSKSPIVNTSLYDGAWAPNRSGHSRIDYVVFPLGIILNETDDSITFSFGHQDLTGHIAKFGLTDLLSSMKVVGAAC